MAFTLPPLSDQQEIVRRVEALFALARQVERRLDRSRAAAASLVQSILSSAFRGELVETEAELARREGRDYEPASELLKRIRAEREQQNGEKALPVKRSKRSAARQDGPPKSIEGSKQNERAEEKPAPRRKQNTIAAKPPIEDIDRDDVMAGIRELFAGGAELDRDQAIRQIARKLGYQRTGSRIQEVLSGHIRSAVRRGIIFSEQGIYAADCRTIDEYPRDELIKNLLAAMGNTWWQQPDAIRAAARHLGFRRTGAKIEKAFKSAINGAIRRGLLERDGGELRRT